MVRVIVLGRVRQHQSWAKPPEDGSQFLAGDVRVAKSAVGNSGAKQLRAQQSCGSGHLQTANRSEIGDGLCRLALVPPTEHADANGRAVRPCPGQGSAAKQFCVVRMGDDGQHTFVGKVEFHGRGCVVRDA